MMMMMMKHIPLPRQHEFHYRPRIHNHVNLIIVYVHHKYVPIHGSIFLPPLDVTLWIIIMMMLIMMILMMLKKK
jgi:hypothetical protein